MEVEITFVAGDPSVGVLPVDAHIPKSLLGAHDAASGELANDETVRFREFSFVDHFPHFLKVLRCAFGIEESFSWTGPDRVFVELDALILWVSKDHGAQAAVAHRKRLVPVRSRLLIPETVFCLERTGQETGKDNEYAGSDHMSSILHEPLLATGPPKH